MALPNHLATELSVYDMVLNRLPFMEDTETNQDLCSDYTLELMTELEICFQVDKDLTIPPDESRIGNENNYSLAQRVVLADLVSYYIVFRLSVIKTVGDSSDETSVPLASFLKSAKAGSVDVEFEQIDVKKSNIMASSVSSMMDLFKKSAIRKARVLGCTIDVCDDCLTVACSLGIRPASFKITKWSC